MQVADFSVYCPKVLAGIVTRDWPDTVLDRSIVIRLQRKKRGETVERLRVLAPKSPESHSYLYAIHHRTRNHDALRALLQRVDEVELDLADSNRVSCVLPSTRSATSTSSG